MAAADAAVRKFLKNQRLFCKNLKRLAFKLV
jgi:hypothetical protein